MAQTSIKVDNMKPKAIKRRVLAVDTSNQLSLLGELVDAVAPESCAGVPGNRLAVRFEMPDPKDIFINQVRLDEHLTRTGQRTPLRVRALLDDLSFEEFEKDYQPGGRPPYAPRAVVGLILYGIMRGVSSLRDLETLAKIDVGCWWISGGIMPDHSIIGRFIQRHDKVLSLGFFEELTRKVLRVTGTGTAVVAGDGTIIEAASSRYRLMREEALQEALAKARANVQEGAAGDPRVEQLEQAQRQLEERRQERAAHGRNPDTTLIHPLEPEAVVQPQKDKNNYRASYKPQVLANEARIIVACDVHPSSETAIVAGLLDQAGRLGAVHSALYDAGYFSKGVIDSTAARTIELLCPEGREQGEEWLKQSEKCHPKSRFAYDAETDRYRCPGNQWLTPVGRYRGNADAPAYVVYGTPACAGCAQRERCTRSQSGRQIKRYICDAAKDALRAKMTQSEVRQCYRQRKAMVEPVFSQLRGRQGLNRFRRKGLTAVCLEFALHAMAYNLSRAMALAMAPISLIKRTWRRWFEDIRRRFFVTTPSPGLTYVMAA